MGSLRDTPQAQSSCRCVNVNNFVSTRLWRDEKSNNYKSWKEQMLCLIQSEGLLDFIDANISPSPEGTSDGYVVWRRTDWQVKGWILGALSDEVAENVVTFETARDVWLELERTFTQPQGSSAPPSPPVEQGSAWADFSHVRPLYRAILKGDCENAIRILEQYPAAAHAPIAFTLETPLIIAVGIREAIPIVRKIVETLTADDQLAPLAWRSGIGFNALHVAALSGNTAAARILVARLPDLLYGRTNKGNFPVQIAALYAQRETLEFLILRTMDDGDPNPYAGETGARLLIAAIDADFLDIAIKLADKYPNMATIRTSMGSALGAIALKESAFLSGARFNLWKRLIYTGLAWLEGAQHSVASEIHCACATTTPNSGDVEDPAACSAPHCEIRRWYRSVHDNFHSSLRKLIKQLVPCMNEIHDKKMMHQRALELVKCLCKHIDSLSDKEGSWIYTNPLLNAAELGIHEVVEVIVETFPSAVYSYDSTSNEYIFHMAVRNRCEKIWNLIYQASDHKHHLVDEIDASGNTLLHLAATLAPPHKLNLVSGAALQMQREIQWFKEVEQWIRPYNKDRVNKDNKTPKMIFTEEHKNLKAEGEKWMKDTANSCTIAAALIATVIFAAAITVPGGNESDSGYPLFSNSSAFIIFAISNAISLFTSTTSLLMFLSILTSRYAEEDFLYALPMRLCIGLVTLFISISFMIAAFSATIFLVFGRKQAWVLIPVAALACLPIASFVLLQFPLLVDVISSTYGRGIFGKQSDRPFY